MGRKKFGSYVIGTIYVEIGNQKISFPMCENGKEQKSKLVELRRAIRGLGTRNRLIESPILNVNHENRIDGSNIFVQQLNDSNVMQKGDSSLSNDCDQCTFPENLNHISNVQTSNLANNATENFTEINAIENNGIENNFVFNDEEINDIQFDYDCDEYFNEFTADSDVENFNLSYEQLYEDTVNDFILIN
ncbi:hypothetical protein TRFO_09607 [Tritrichomonas foetus]|uniref:Uncharacterized protein n=1 Tax=Tritrichomonas foetus TaxID=1144522 RepID=A0A1J4JDA2_9EUKA|nr:hypothetical protein TRFO_09607 [Tritrichomonas foetus]|eukprot:OHS97072.1 hypothetical protein TRFO_09607 [Tritrichomonas foetus]